MGFDLFGKKPSAPAGESFSCTVWCWGGLWTYCQAIAPTVTEKVRSARTNDGDGLEIEDAYALGRKVRLSIEDGSADRWRLQRLESGSQYVVRELQTFADFASFLTACGGFEIW